MPIGEGVSRSIVFKEYATGIIDANTQPVSTTDPANTGGQVLRRVSSTVNLTKETYQSAEIRRDRQIGDFRHGIKRVTGAITCEYSPGTYDAFIEAAMRHTWTAAVATTESTLTSVAADNSTSRFTFGGGNPVTVGYRVGDILRFTNLATAANNDTNFVITGFSGTDDRVVDVYPAPTTMAADTAFNVTNVKAVWVPSSGHVSRKFAIEHYSADTDMSQLFTECRIAGMNIRLPATGLATIEFPVMGRDMEILSGGSAPFFGSPTEETTTGIFAAVNGLLRVGGENIGVVTGLEINMDLSPSSDAVVGQNFVPEIHLGRANVSGSMTALFEDATLVNYFKNETEVEILCYLTTTSSGDTSPASTTIHLPRVKFGGADIATSGEGSVPITMPFQALKSTEDEATTGLENTTIRIVDSEIA